MKYYRLSTQKNGNIGSNPFPKII